jgi:hypothetical protein
MPRRSDLNFSLCRLVAVAVDTDRIMKVGLELAGWKKMPADSAVHIKGKNINKVLIGIDIGTAELMLAKQLECDAVIAHHPIGATAVNFYKVFDTHTDYMVEHGVPKKIAREAVEKLTMLAFTVMLSELPRCLACLLSISTSHATNTCDRLYCAPSRPAGQNTYQILSNPLARSQNSAMLQPRYE